MKAQEVLTANFWREFGSMADTDGYHAVLLALEDPDSVEGYSKIAYSDLPLWDWLEDYSDLKRAELAYTVCGQAVGKVAESLAKNYDPLENFFTDGTSDTDYGKTVTKSGKENTTPLVQSHITGKANTRLKPMTQLHWGSQQPMIPQIVPYRFRWTMLTVLL